jgi:uncharacterized SAM-binding protein YcdF (DUF218 family)
VIWEIGTVAKHLVLPPLGLVWPLLAAWWVLRARPRLARWLLGTALATLVILATPLVADSLLELVRVPSSQARFGQARAIVILGGGRGLIWDEVHERVVDAYPGPFTLERLHAGARLAARTGLPVLVSAGKPDHRDPTEAEVMRRFLADNYKQPPKWVEDRSRNTAENADFSARILLPQGIRTIILVTSGFHMRRSKLVFEQAGFDVLPYPAPPEGPDGEIEWRDFLPAAQGLMRSHYALHELVGIGYSLLRAKPTPAATSGN